MREKIEMSVRTVNHANRNNSTKKGMRERANSREDKRMNVRRLNRNNVSERKRENVKTNKDREDHALVKKSTSTDNKDLDLMIVIEIDVINKDPARKNTNAGEENSASDLTALQRARTLICLTIPRKWIS